MTCHVKFREGERRIVIVRFEDGSLRSSSGASLEEVAKEMEPYTKKHGPIVVIA